MEETNKPSTLKILLSICAEIAIILFLTGIVFFVLNYFKLINISSIVNQNSSKEGLSDNAANKTPSGSNSNSLTRVINPALPNMQVIVESGALDHEFQVFEFGGKINAVVSAPGFDPVNNIPFAYKLEVGVGTSSAHVELFYPSPALEKIKVTDSQNKPLELKDLRKGDSVTIKTTLSTYHQYPDNYYDVQITKK